ncbi:flagellar basal-body rod protein FlgG [Carnobacterium iners]|uniref:Flagellar basal-body rod protein FlgG n=1 Tax=Carnobacterium iners TaxID=1073423 RepID=A0A1X7N2M6_9LACT|nr:flagellar hook-basal body protein [Carnobacterium iners]SEK22492.1 flagellar basal-body rod protein FlgG [Carnobacterium iners]SMH31016.1 flagellar basal-body rod protein FlgG [Carnobacterium iners]
MSIPLSISKSGLNAIQTSMDALSNDIANVNTTGYKSKNIRFNELLKNDMKGGNILLSDQAQNGAINRGTKSGYTTMNHAQGSLISDTNPYHLAIEGNGFFGVTDTNNQFYLTRDGAFQLNGDKSITNGNGDRLAIEAAIPVEQWPEGDVSISETGDVRIQSANGNTLVGKISLFNPANTDAMVSVGENKFSYIGDFVEQDGLIQQHYLEASNTDLATAITDMMLAQRSYSLNMKVAQGTDEMMSVINQFKQ